MDKKIKILGIGDFGIAVVDNLSKNLIEDADYLSVNTDWAFLDWKNKNHLRMGENFTRGLGAGALSEIGMRAAEESKELIVESLKDAKYVIIIAGFGGGTGSGATPVFAKYAKELNIPCYIFATLPFEFENKFRQRNVDFAVKKLNELDSHLIKLKTFPLSEQNIDIGTHTKHNDVSSECAKIFHKHILSL